MYALNWQASMMQKISQEGKLWLDLTYSNYCVCHTPLNNKCANCRSGNICKPSLTTCTWISYCQWQQFLYWNSFQKEVLTFTYHLTQIVLSIHLVYHKISLPHQHIYFFIFLGKKDMLSKSMVSQYFDTSKVQSRVKFMLCNLTLLKGTFKTYISEVNTLE